MEVARAVKGASRGHTKKKPTTAPRSDSRTQDGWTRLKLSVPKTSTLSQSQQLYGAGFLEVVEMRSRGGPGGSRRHQQQGYITQHLIFAAYYNFANGTTLPLTPQMQALITKQNQAQPAAPRGAVLTLLRSGCRPT